MAVQKQRRSSGRFAKGNSLGFKLPKGTTKLSVAYQKQLAQPAPGVMDGRTFAEVIAERVCLAAAPGDISAAREIADRCEGKARQAIDIDMQVSDWRQLAADYGVSEADVIREARQLIESADEPGDCDGD